MKCTNGAKLFILMIGIYVCIIFQEVNAFAMHAVYKVTKINEHTLKIRLGWEDPKIQDGLSILYYRLQNAKVLTIGYEKQLQGAPYQDLELDISGALLPLRIVLQREDDTSPLFSDISKDKEYEFIAHLHGMGVLQGRPDGSLGARDRVTRAEFVTILLRTLQIKPEDSVNLPYKDIRNHWAKGYMAVALNKGMMKGFQDGTIQPDRAISLAEAASIIARTFTFQTKAKKIVPHLREGTWYYDSVKKMFDLGILHPGDRVYLNFNEERAIDRSTAIMLISRATSTY